MRIGIDMDDTICNTTQIVQERVRKYAKSNNLNELDIMNDEDLKQGFFNIYLEDIYTNVTPKEDALRVVKRLKSRGNEIYIITARSNNFSNTVKNVEEITSAWLKKYGIEVDKIITSAYGDTKSEACKKYKIDYMIDDDPYNFKRISSVTKCIIYDDMDRFEGSKNILTKWKDIETYIERNR